MTRASDQPDGAWLLDRRVLQAERDVARADRRATQAERRANAAEAAAAESVRVAQHALHVERAHTQALQAALDGVHASTSWRISRPVRAAAGLLHALRASGAPMAAPSPVAAPLSVPQGTVADGPDLPTREQAILQRLRARRRA